MLRHSPDAASLDFFSELCTLITSLFESGLLHNQPYIISMRWMIKDQMILLENIPKKWHNCTWLYGIIRGIQDSASRLWLVVLCLHCIVLIDDITSCSFPGVYSKHGNLITTHPSAAESHGSSDGSPLELSAHTGCCCCCHTSGGPQPAAVSCTSR